MAGNVGNQATKTNGGEVATLGSAQVPLEVGEATDASAPAQPGVVVPPRTATQTSRHSLLVRITHWIITLCFFALLITGGEILLSHPRFYWGETGNVLTQPLFKIPVPSSRDMVPTGYNYVLPDQNGWSRALHFQAAWVAVLTALLYGIYGSFSGHFRRNLVPTKSDLSWRAVSQELTSHLRFRASANGQWSYNVIQRFTYLAVIFVLFPLVIWTGLAMSPAFTGAFPSTVILLGGRQSARTIHFFVSIALTLFLLVHVAMICISGFRSRMRAMIVGRPISSKEDA